MNNCYGYNYIYLHLLFFMDMRTIRHESQSGDYAMLNTKVNAHTLTDITLPQYQTWTIGGNRRGDVITCVKGMLWVTQQGDLKDYIIEAGRSFWVTRPGTIIVQALDHSQFKYSLNELKDHVENNHQPYQPTNQPRLGNPR
jgi:hypothetical protein